MTHQATPVDNVVQVRLFAALRERAGWGERPVALDSGLATATDLWQRLALDAGPAVGTIGLPPTIRVAINQVFAASDTLLRPGDEVAFLPPISGG